MIKKLLSITIALVVITSISVVAQITCVPDGQYTAAGVYPDTLVGLPCAETDEAYETTITVIAPVDSLYDLGFPIGVINATIDSIVIQDNSAPPDGVSVNGLPAGINYVCNPPSCSFPGGSTGCLLLIGTPTVPGTYNIAVEVDAYVQELVSIPGANPINMDKVDQYFIVVSTATPPTASIVVVNTTATPPLCNGSATASGGVTYQWDNDAGAGTSATASGLCAGTYNVAAIDVNGCAGVATATVTSATPCVPTVTGFTSNDVGLSVAFTDASSDATSWAWDFGDGNTSTLEDPTNTYSADGTYNVCLVTTNVCSADSTCTSITITSGGCTPCVAGFTSADNDLSVTFTDASSDVTGWLWDFNDGSTSNLANPVHTYTTDGTYDVCLYTSNPCSTDSICSSVTVVHTGIEQDAKVSSFSEVKAVPNPFSGLTGITFNLKEAEMVSLIVFDMAGRILYSETVDGKTGNNVIEFDAKGINPGLYMYNLLSGEHSVSGKLTVTK